MSSHENTPRAELLFRGTSESPSDRAAPLASRAPRFGRPGPKAVLALLSAGFVLAYIPVLLDLSRFALASDFHSYVLLAPLVSGWLIWQRRPDLPPAARAPRLAGLVWTLAVVALAVGLAGDAFSWFADPETEFVLKVGSLLLFVLGSIAFTFGSAMIRALAFPLGFLVFLLPIPPALLRPVEHALQYGSATVAHALFAIAGTPVLLEDLVLRLPGFSMQVAPQCSGIRSTVVLLLTSLVASHLFFVTRWKKAVLVSAVVPLAFLRNGARVFVIGQLCVNVGPEMIHSDIHVHGGPLFFALSLVPFSALLIFLWRWRRPAGAAEAAKGLR